MRYPRGLGVSVSAILLFSSAAIPTPVVAMPDPTPDGQGSRLLAAPSQVAATDDQWKTLELSWEQGATNPEPAGWQSVGFDDTGWDAAYIPTDPYPEWVDIPGADWLSSTGRATGHLASEIWIARHEFMIGGAPDGDGTLTWNVDNTASIWVNGQSLASGADNWTTITTTTIPQDALQPGRNVIAVKVTQSPTFNTWPVNPTMFQAKLQVSHTPIVCDDEDLSSRIEPTEPGDRVTVTYDPRYLVDPLAVADFEEAAEFIASLIKQRAEDALDHYDNLQLATPASATLEISCRIEFELFPVPSNPQPPGFTGDVDRIQLLASNIALWLSSDAKSDFPAQGTAWNVPGHTWRGLVDHEAFHLVQWASRPGPLDGLRRRWILSDHTWTESPAALAQDLFLEVDDAAGATAGSYLEQVGLFADERVPLDAPLIPDMDRAPQYRLAGALQYWAERFGPSAVSNLETRVARFLDKLVRTPAGLGEVVDFGRTISYDWAADQYGSTRGAYGRAISALRDYYVAHFALGASNVSASEQSRYAILDAETGHGLAPGIQPAQGVGDYPELLGIREELDLTPGSDTQTADLPATRGEVYLIPVPAGTVDVELEISAAAVDGATADSAMRVAFIPMGADGSMVLDGALMPNGPQPGKSLARIVGMTGRTQLALVLVAGDKTLSYTVNARALVGQVAVEIVDPTLAEPYRVATALEPMIIRARPTINGQMPSTLDASSFELTIGGIHVNPSSAILRGGSYRIEGNIPNALPAGTHPVRLAYGGTEVDVPGGVTIDAGLPPLEYLVEAIDFDAVGQGESEATAVTIAAGAGRASFSADWVGSDFDLVLTAPSGRIIDEASTDPDVTIAETPSSVDIAVASPEPGEWMLAATGTDVPAPEPLTLSATEAATPVHGELVVEHGPAAGEPIAISFALADEAGGVTDASVVATLTDPTGQALSVPLHDDGGHDDGGASDGVYATTLWAADAPGDYRVEVRAAGNDADRQPLMRYGSTSISLLAMTDGDGDGVSDAAEATFGTDPANGADGDTDHDGDGLGLAAELAAALDPHSWDTDGGGEHDASELAAGSDPRTADDDADVPTPAVSARADDGGLLSLSLGTDDGTGSLRLWRVQSSGLVDLGTHPGTESTFVDGPLPDGIYSYRAIGVAPNGAESAPNIVGPIRAAGDVTPPIFRLVANNGQWDSSDIDVELQFMDLSEPATQMRVAFSPEALETTAWVPFAETTSISVPAVEGQHLVHGQVRDAAGNASGVTTAFVFVVDETPPVSAAGPLNAAIGTPTVSIPYTASDDISGVASVTLWWRHRPDWQAPWSAWTAGPVASASPIAFTLSAGEGRYEFRTIAADVAGNVEAPPSAADAATTHAAGTAVWAWGPSLRIGTESQAPCWSSCPTIVLGVPDPTAVSASNHTLAVTGGGALWAWGLNDNGQVGDGTTTTRSYPVQVIGLADVTAVAAGATHSLALKADGTVWAWGSNQQGQLGVTPPDTRVPTQVPGLSGVVAIAAGGSHSLALKADGTVWAWGGNFAGQLGDNSTTNRPTPVQSRGLTGIVKITAGQSHSLAIGSDGSLWAWGENGDGQLGIGSDRDKRTPTKLRDIQNVTSVAGGSWHTLATSADGLAWAWGDGFFGQLGFGTIGDQLTPRVIPGLNGIASVAAGSFFSAALTGDGQVWMWGRNNSGQLGDGTTSDRTNPQAVPNLGVARLVAAGSAHTIAVSDGVP